MTPRRTLLKLLGAATLSAAAVTFSATASQATDVTLRLHQLLPAQASVPKNVLQPWMERIEAASEGRIKFQHFPSMQLGGKPPELYDQAIDGVADIIWTIPGYTPGRFPRTEVFELPFTITDAESASRAYWLLGEETMMDADFKDVKVLALWVHAPGVIHSKEPIESIDDLEGVKLRAPTRVTNQMFNALGATPVGMPVPAVPEALSKGVIDATVIPWEITTALKTSELVGNHTEFGGEALYTTTFVLAMNKERFNALPDDLKAVIDEHSGLEFSAMAGKQSAIDGEGPKELTYDLGNNIIELTPDQVAEWKAAAQPTIDAWIAEMEAQGIDGAALRNRALELIKQHSSM
ncbi:MAG: C4-dicarboxylate ABC transporter [Rhodobacteraceae bacterium]|nr:C4-dicarboxylate ABC transporter [Paracoccaceae bacterium]